MGHDKGCMTCGKYKEEYYLCDRDGCMKDTSHLLRFPDHKLKPSKAVQVADACNNMEWNPIETAPRDGSYFIVWVGNQWHGDDYIIVKFMSGTYLSQNGDPYSPTHWKPLPPPPK